MHHITGGRDYVNMYGRKVDPNVDMDIWNWLLTWNFYIHRNKNSWNTYSI
jgi:hypothetical protein